MNNKIGDVSSSHINSLIAVGESLGVDRATILKQNRLTEQSLNDPEGRLGLVTLMKVGNSIIHHSKQPALGLIAGHRAVITALGYPGLLAMNSGCLGDAVQALCYFEPILARCNRGQSSLDSFQDMPRLNFYSIAPYNEYNLFVVDRALSSWYQIISWLTNRTDLVSSVHFEFKAPFYANEYKKYFQCPVFFGAEANSLNLVEDALEVPVVYSNPIMFDSLLQQCNQVLNDISKTETIGQLVQKALGPLLHESNPSLERVAEVLAMQPWTLRRRLSEQGLSFHTILEDMRKDLAINYVKNPKLSLGEIAYTMGFSSASAFQRAFKRWTGITAGEFKKNILRDL